MAKVLEVCTGTNTESGWHTEVLCWLQTCQCYQHQRQITAIKNKWALGQSERGEVFSTLDLRAGYWQIPLRQEDKCKTAFLARKERRRILATIWSRHQRARHHSQADHPLNWPMPSQQGSLLVQSRHGKVEENVAFTNLNMTTPQCFFPKCTRQKEFSSWTSFRRYLKEMHGEISASACWAVKDVFHFKNLSVRIHIPDAETDLTLPSNNLMSACFQTAHFPSVILIIIAITTRSPRWNALYYTSFWSALSTILIVLCGTSFRTISTSTAVLNETQCMDNQNSLPDEDMHFRAEHIAKGQNMKYIWEYESPVSTWRYAQIYKTKTKYREFDFILW